MCYHLTTTTGTSTIAIYAPVPDADNAVRIVRWGLADVLRWLGENVGPRPNDPFSVVANCYPWTRG